MSRCIIKPINGGGMLAVITSEGNGGRRWAGGDGDDGNRRYLWSGSGDVIDEGMV